MFALSQELRKAATTSVNAILRFAPMAAVTCNGLIAKAPDEIVDSLNRSPDLSNDDVLRVVDQLQLLASALEADPGGPMKLISMTVKTHGHQPLSFDFDWDVAVDAPADQRKYPRPPILVGELGLLRSVFGRDLNLKEVILTAPPDGTYNCLAYTVGELNEWVWGPLQSGETNLEWLDAKYLDYGYVRDIEGPIAAWGIGEHQILHVSRMIEATGMMESKLGKSFRALHPVPAIPGGLYQSILYHYRLK